ncbi:minor capsid protein [Thermoclostridium stercorarium]|uniref:minor capsid protein n=2 Tax=Thermoclostridium stercorarium TaxID=1510 RepID=UPI001FA7FFF8|nr:minor capsid protein [Thermoclostridium stercorarium]
MISLSKNNMKYWEERQKRIYLAGEKKVNDYYKELKKAFEQAKKEIHSVINDFYIRYAKENKVSFAEAQRRLEKAEIGELEEFIAKVNQHMGEYNLELNNMSIKARITRYQALEKQIDAILQRLYAIDYQYKGEETLKEVYKDSYYRTWFNIDQYRGFHQEFAQINPRTIDELIRYPFNGADFSSRIWKQKNHMLQQLTESITTMLVQGRNPQTLAEDFARKFKTKEYEAYRLLHTESSFIIEQGTLAAYKEDGVKKYQIVATLDMRTSDICRSEDGKIYDVDEATVGVNYPPYHPFCRTTTVPYYEDAEVGTRVARDPVTGRSYEVPANMTYEQWYDFYITGETEKEFNEKIVGLKTSNGIEIVGASKHAIEQAIMRKVPLEGIRDALMNPLKIGKIKVDDQERKSQRFIGSYATVNVNPETGVIATLWRTGTSTRRKFGVNRNGD